MSNTLLTTVIAVPYRSHKERLKLMKKFLTKGATVSDLGGVLMVQDYHRGESIGYAADKSTVH
jgi:hypothetical protein